jgi:hypothetical protein
MRPRVRLALLTLIALLLALSAALIVTEPTSARVDLTTAQGEAVWFFRACQPAQPGDVAAWSVQPAPFSLVPRSLRFRITNAYPGYQLRCDLVLANSGETPIAATAVLVHNPYPAGIAISAGVAPGALNRVLAPCGLRPHWGRDPASLPANCQLAVAVTVTLNPDVAENLRLDFGVKVSLEGKPERGRP